MRFLTSFLLLLLSNVLLGQTDTLQRELNFTGDFRFRAEHDWNSRKPDGSFRTDRSRLRYRFRLGVNYKLDNRSSFGGRFRSGNINDQQGPHVTLGAGNGEFGLVQIGLEKLFYKYEHKGFEAWLGKNSIFLKKENELFWNDNVFPEGVAMRYSRKVNHASGLNNVQLNAGHFIIRSNNQSFAEDSYLQLLQLASSHLDERFDLFSGIYYFNNIGNYPDRQETFQLSYSILHLGGKVNLSKNKNMSVSLEYYLNLQDYEKTDSIPTVFKDQKEGIVLSFKLGALKKKGDWQIHLYLANMEKYSIVDYFAQNDWARWDYSSLNASGARLSNFRGGELRIGYAFQEKFNLILRAYMVEELVTKSLYKESGDRVRLDLNIGF